MVTSREKGLTMTAPVGTLEQQVAQVPVLQDLQAMRETAWFNPDVALVAEALGDVGLTVADIDDAAARLVRFAPYLERAFADLRPSAGIIESPLRAAPGLQRALDEVHGQHLPGRLWLKLDAQLPVSGSIKARGGIYEVLQHAEHVAQEAGLLGEDYTVLDSDAARALFGQHTVAVGSTGNLGLSIGIMAAQLGFQAHVHMSADARQWKKDLLRSHGVKVHEYESDYSVAVEAGRKAAEGDPSVHFVDDENSTSLFLGYAVAARRLAGQLQAQEVRVDAEHPLFVYLPCGVGGGPGGVAFGLKTVFGDAVHCVFAEPTHSPCMLLGVATGRHDEVSVADLGLDNRTAADGLAVGRPSGFVGKAMQRLLDGYLTLDDDEMYRNLARLHATEGIDVEPSATAGFPGPWRVLRDEGYLRRMGLTPERLEQATHLLWCTGGAMVPAEEMRSYVERGERLLGVLEEAVDAESMQIEAGSSFAVAD